jgi:uncharacterized protein YjbI with pentapeptide repeats
MRKSIIAAALLAMSLAGTAQADIRWNGPLLQGVELNGVRLNGLSLNGLSLNGLSLNGISLQGILRNGFRWNAAAANGTKKLPTNATFTSVPLDRVNVVLPAR